jgi:hypothetical protein
VNWNIAVLISTLQAFRAGANMPVENELCFAITGELLCILI